MENNNSSTENIIKEVVHSNHTVDLKNEYKEPDNHKRNYKTVIYIVIFLIITAYASWATYYFCKNTDPLSWQTFNETTSHGYGLLVILYIIYIYFLIHYYILKPFCFPIINRLIWTPAKTVLGKIRFGSLIFYISVMIAVLAFLIVDSKGDKTRLIPLLGIVVFILFGFLLSAHKRQVPWNTIAWGLILQFVFGFMTIRWDVGRKALETFSNHVNTFLDYGVQAAAFTYGEDLVLKQKVFAFNALSVVFFIGFVINLLYYYGLMQRFVNWLGGALQYVMGTSVCESVNSVSVAFVGMSEGPMMLQPYLKYLTDSEMHSMMLAGFASVSGSVFAAYMSYGARAQDLITASIMSAPSALCYSKLLYPEVEEIRIKKKDVHLVEVKYSSAMDAASKGATDAFHLIAAIISGVTATLAFVYFINGVLSWFGLLVGFTDVSNMWTLELIAGKVFIPVAWLMGVEWDECEKVAQLIGIKTMVNEFVAFSRMPDMNLSPRSKVIATYAICGFSNPGSIGILMSTMNALVPEKKECVSKLIFRAFIGGAVVCFMTACIAGALMPDDGLTDLNEFSNATTTMATGTS